MYGDVVLVELLIYLFNDLYIYVFTFVSIQVWRTGLTSREQLLYK